MKYYKDKNNEIYAYDDDFEEIDTNLIPISEDEAEKLMQPVFTLAQLKEQKLNWASKKCDKKIESGFYSKALGEKYFYYSTTEEQQNLTGLCTLGIDNYFKCAKVLEDKSLDTRTMQKHTVTQLKQVLADGVTHISNCVIVKDVYKALIKASTTKEELEAINLETVIAVATAQGLNIDLEVENG